MRILITGGAGFVGSRLAFAFGAMDGASVTVVDNLKRRGSELNIPHLNKSGIEFIHGDVRESPDLEVIPGNFDLMIEASAEPSVAAGETGSPAYTISTNLLGTINCLEFARRRAGRFLFLSTSRVYPIAALRAINLNETPRRFEIAQDQAQAGVSGDGVSEDFPTQGARSFYGATKLASELLIQEYVESCRLEALIDRCSVIAGPGQFGKVDQGVFTLWIAHHYFGLPLRYTGFGGQGKQVRDLLHPSDLADLVRKQAESSQAWRGEVFNIGGGKRLSVSMREMTDLCRAALGREVPIKEVEETASYDVPMYVTDHRRVSVRFGWTPERKLEEVVSETASWIRDNEDSLKPLFCRESS